LNVTHLENDGNSFYNALQMSLARRWKDGVLQFLAAAAGSFAVVNDVQ